MRDVKIIGIGGLPRSGKDMLAELLIERGFFGVSLGDISRDNARQRHADKPDPISVANMTETSNWMRESGGADVILKEAMKRFHEAQKTKSFKGLVLFSIRAPIEVDYILANGGDMVWMETDDTIRYQRYIQNLREGEIELSLQDLKGQEALQWQPQPGVPTEAQMNIAYVKDNATIVIENDGNDLEAFKIQAEVALKSYLI